jgi:hypothetical protein
MLRCQCLSFSKLVPQCFRNSENGRGFTRLWCFLILVNHYQKMSWNFSRLVLTLRKNLFNCAVKPRLLYLALLLRRNSGTCTDNAGGKFIISYLTYEDPTSLEMLQRNRHNRLSIATSFIVWKCQIAWGRERHKSQAVENWSNAISWKDWNVGHKGNSFFPYFSSMYIKTLSL